MIFLRKFVFLFILVLILVFIPPGRTEGIQVTEVKVLLMAGPSTLHISSTEAYAATFSGGNIIQLAPESLELAQAKAGLHWVSLFFGTQGEIESAISAYPELWPLLGKPVLAEIGVRLSLSLGPFWDLSQAQWAKGQAQSHFPQAEVVSPSYSLLFRRQGSVDLGWGGDADGPSLLFSPSGNGNFLYLNDRKYRGNLQLFWKNGELRIINILDLESYLYGVVPAEMPHDWPTEALKAQALASRSYALKKIQENNNLVEGYDLNITIYDQVYRGYEAETSQTNAAVDQTKGQVLTYAGEIITAAFHSCSGGHTENNENVWRGSPLPYLRGVPSPGEEGSKYYRWTQTVTVSDFLRKLEEKKGILLGNFQSLNILEKGVSGRVKVLEVIGTTGTTTLSGEELRKIANLRSSLISFDSLPGEAVTSLTLISASGIQEISLEKMTLLSAQGESPSFSPLTIISAAGLSTWQKDSTPAQTGEFITFSGQGWGHGVGMSQWGAKARAEEGLTYREILSYYYQGVQIESQY